MHKHINPIFVPAWDLYKHTHRATNYAKYEIALLGSINYTHTEFSLYFPVSLYIHLRTHKSLGILYHLYFWFVFPWNLDVKKPNHKFIFELHISAFFVLKIRRDHPLRLDKKDTVFLRQERAILKKVSTTDKRNCFVFTAFFIQT